MKTHPALWECFKEKERVRKRLERMHQTKEQKDINREQSKIRQRLYKQRMKDKGVKVKPKAPRILTRSEREKQRIYWRETQKKCRINRTSQKERRVKEHDKSYRQDIRQPRNFFRPDQQNSTSQSTEYSNSAIRQSASRAKRKLPKNATQFAETISYIVEKATPTKQSELKKKGLIYSPNQKKKQFCRKKIVDILKAKIKRNKPTKSYVLAAMKIMKKNKMTRTTSLLFEVGPSDISRACGESKARAKRKDAVNDYVRKKLDFHYNQPSVATTLPDKRAVRGGKERKVLDRPLRDVYEDFKDDNPDINIGFSTFAAKRPSNILTSKHQPMYSCLCDVCTNIDLKLRTLNNFSDKVKKPEMKIRDRYQAVNITMCDKGENKFHKIDCINRQCGDCQTDLLMAHLQPLLQEHGNETVEFAKWEKAKTKSRQGKEVSKVFMVKHRVKLCDMIIEAMEDLSIMARHLFNAKWQQLQFSGLIKNIPTNWVVLNLDFAENYACISQMEIQTAHWFHQQVTIHPVVAYYNCHKCDETVQECLYFVSDDLTHDAHAVHRFVSATNAHLRNKRGIDIEHQVQFSDGCASQYKSVTPFIDISYSFNDFGFPVERHFYGSRHGKGPCDGAAAVLKSAARRAVMGQVCVINNSQELYEFANSKLAKDDKPESDEHLHSKCTVFHISDIPRNRPDRIGKTVKGTRSMHCVKAKDDMNIYVRKQSCLCQACKSDVGQCENVNYVDSWSEVHILRRGERQQRGASGQGRIRGARGEMRGRGRARASTRRGQGRSRDSERGGRGQSGSSRKRGDGRGSVRTRGGRRGHVTVGRRGQDSGGRRGIDTGGRRGQDARGRRRQVRTRGGRRGAGRGRNNTITSIYESDSSVSNDDEYSSSDSRMSIDEEDIDGSGELSLYRDCDELFTDR
ncbi:MAG: hypothetical protein ABW168_00060 [Sedimenticola sp.]